MDGNVLLPASGLHQVPESVFAFVVLSAHSHKSGADGADLAAGHFKFEPKQAEKDSG
jgi:hypothetical protein